ncbi:MAG: glycerol-3-phosphate responsive antiterminator [Treponema sp.]|jgi:glycerol uptake operon antiterminator|nr:glycerol-3-phosphate responsive antiterminator [Treponema sp.]
METVILQKKRHPGPELFKELLRKTPVILAVKSMEGLEICLAKDCGIIFILFGDIVTIPGIVAKIKEAKKIAMVHMDLIDGLASKDIAVDFLAGQTRADGVLSTKPSLVKYAKHRELLTIQRFFVLDSLSLLNIEKQFPLEYADAIEILPGVMPKIIRKITENSKKPIIAGGLISDQEDVRHALNAGAVSVSTTNIGLLS